MVALLGRLLFAWVNQDVNDERDEQDGTLDHVSHRGLDIHNRHAIEQDAGAHQHVAHSALAAAQPDAAEYHHQDHVTSGGRWILWTSRIPGRCFVCSQNLSSGNSRIIVSAVAALKAPLL